MVQYSVYYTVYYADWGNGETSLPCIYIQQVSTCKLLHCTTFGSAPLQVRERASQVWVVGALHIAFGALYNHMGTHGYRALQGKSRERERESYEWWVHSIAVQINCAQFSIALNWHYIALPFGTTLHGYQAEKERELQVVGALHIAFGALYVIVQSHGYRALQGKSRERATSGGCTAYRPPVHMLSSFRTSEPH